MGGSMATLESRLNKLEDQTNIKAQSGTELMLNVLRAVGFDYLCNSLAEHDEREEPEPFWLLMNLMDDSRNPLEFERYRGLVPDEVIRRAYSHRRNWAFDQAVIIRVRQLAGVIDADGNVMPGYVLTDSDNIVDAPNESSTV